MNRRIYEPDNKFYLKSIITAFKREMEEGYVFNGEAHDFWEMVIVLKGNITVTEEDRVYRLSKNDVIFHKPMEFHRFVVHDKEGAEIMVISFAFEGNEIDGLGDGVIKFDLSFLETLLSVFNAITDTFDVVTERLAKKVINYNSIKEKLVFSKFEAFLLETLSLAMPTQTGKCSASATHYKKIINILNEHIYENLSVKQIASLCFMGKSNLHKIFNLYTGCGVMQHFQKMKIIKAITLLKEGKSVGEISEMLSFSSPNYFSMVFKKETGMLPSAYKKMNRAY